MVLNKNSNEDLEKYFREAVKTIFALMAAMVIAAGIWSCRSVKEAVEASEEVVAVSKIDLSEVSKVEATEWVVESEWLNRMVLWNRDVKAVVYDTSKPVDSVTGKSPVLMEIVASETARDSVVVSNESTIEREMQREDSVAVAVADSVREDIKIEEKMDKGYSFEMMSNLLLMGLIVGLTAGMGAMWWIKKG